jgi:tRNA isopentenyl-2-thiomethyl-A-37 hydroxylase MiaE
MEPQVKSNDKGKLTAGSIVSFKYKDEQTTGIVYATNSTHDVYIVKHISNDPKKQGMIGTIQLAGKDIIDTKSLIEKETLQNDSVVYYFLQKLNNLTSAIKASRRISSKSLSRRTSSKSPSRMTQRILPSRKTPAEMISARYAGYRKTRRNHRHKK